MQKIILFILSVLSTVSYSQKLNNREIKEAVINTLTVNSLSFPDSIYPLNGFLSWSQEQKLPDKWYPLETAPKEPLQQDSFWLRIRLNIIQNEKYVLYLHDLPDVSVFVVKENNPIPEALRAGTLIKPALKQMPTGLILERIGNSSQVQLSLDTGNYEVYMKVYFVVPEIFRPQLRLYPEKIWEKAVFEQREYMLPFQGIILGALLILTLYHLLIYFQRKDVSFLLYSLYTFTISMVVWSEIGLMQIYLFPDYPIFYRISHQVLVFAGLATVVYFLFMRSFVHLDKLLPKLDVILIWYLRILIPSSILCILIYFWTLHPLFPRLAYLYSFSGLLLGI
jgi:7TM diverse intracellular signalling